MSEVLVGIPQTELDKVSRRATELAAKNAPKDTGRGASRLQPSSTKGEVGVFIPPDVIYMAFQEKGIKSFVMWQLAGKTIPIRGADGRINFRRATLQNIGRRRITSRDERGRIVASKLTWWHPGLKPKNFIHNAIQQAVQEWVRDLPTSKAVEILRTELGADIDQLVVSP